MVRMDSTRPFEGRVARWPYPLPRPSPTSPWKAAQRHACSTMSCGASIGATCAVTSYDVMNYIDTRGRRVWWGRVGPTPGGWAGGPAGRSFDLGTTLMDSTAYPRRVATRRGRVGS